MTTGDISFISICLGLTGVVLSILHDHIRDGGFKSGKQKGWDEGYAYAKRDFERYQKEQKANKGRKK